MKMHVERSAIVVGRSDTGMGMDVTKDGEVLLVFQHEGTRTSVLVSPEEAEAYGVGIIQRAAVARTLKSAAPIAAP